MDVLVQKSTVQCLQVTVHKTSMIDWLTCVQNTM